MKRAIFKKNIFKLIYDFRHTPYIHLLCFRHYLDYFNLLKSKANIILLDTSNSFHVDDVLFFLTLRFI